MVLASNYNKCYTCYVMTLNKQNNERKNMKVSIEDFKRMSTIKRYISYPEVDGKFRFGVRTGGGTYRTIWARNEEEAFEIANKDFYL